MRLILCLLLVLLALPALSQPIYRVVDEHGNVTYTDQKPANDSQPIDLPALSVVGADGNAPPPVVIEAPEPERESLDFRIVDPVNGERRISDGGPLQVTLASRIDLPPAAQVVLILNGEALPPVRSMVAALDGVEPGAHSLVAELRTESGRVLATTDTVRFQIELAAD